MNVTVNISLPKGLADAAKNHVQKGHYTSFSELVRSSLRKTILEDPDIPTFKMSKKAEKAAMKAMKDYKDGKAIEFKSIKDLN